MDTEELLYLINKKKRLETYIPTKVISENEAMGKISKKPLLLICNTDPVWLPGKHWVVFYFPEKGLPEFFDSFGKRPETYAKDFQSFLIHNSKNGSYLMNTWQLQRNGSNVCGPYCILYVDSKYQNVSFDGFVQQFNAFFQQNNDLKCVEKIQTLFNVYLNF